MGRADVNDGEVQKRENVEETFNNLRIFCQTQLNFSFRNVDKMIDSLIKRSDAEVSPLLKFYNELVAHSNFRLPVKALLEFDTRVFRESLVRIKRAQRGQL